MTSNFDLIHDVTSFGNEDISAIIHLVFPDKIILTNDKMENSNVSQNIIDLLHCPWCKARPTSIEQNAERSSLRFKYCCSSLYCYQCHANWYLCSDCSVNEIYPLLHGKGGSGRTACHRRKKKFMEHVQSHREQASISQEGTADNMRSDESNSEMNDFVVSDDAESSSITAGDRNGMASIHRDDSIHNIRCIFNHSESCHIGEFMIHEFTGRASRHIIQESVMGSSLFSTSKDISTNDSLLFMLLFSIGTRMSREERNKLATMISLIQKKVEEETLIAHGMLSANHTRIPLPVASYDMRRIFESGKQQFTNYMPMPIILSPTPGYASISLPKTLQIMYSRGKDWDNKYLFHSSHDCPVRTSRSILKGKIANDIMNSIMEGILDPTEMDSTVLQPIVAWSDSADLNKVKNNRSSIKVHNIYVPHSDGQSPDCVFPMAIGSGRSSHDTYRKKMFNEINDLHQGSIMCFNQSSRNINYIRFFLLAVVQDRPEYSEFTGTIAHNGKYGALPGYSFPRSICVGSLPGVTVLKPLISCRECYTRRINYLCGTGGRLTVPIDNRSCNNCYDWDVTRVQFRRPPKMPKDIPVNCYLNQNNNQDVMVSKLVTFESMKNCLQYIHDKAYAKQWTHYANTVQSFASLECVNGALAKAVYESAKNLRKLHIQEEGMARAGSQRMNVELLPPALLSPHLSMDQCMVGIMHTFFLNGGKKVLTVIHDVFKKEASGTFYLTKSKLVLRDVRAMSLSWIMAWPFGSTADKPMAPWVSENYVAYYQICKSHASLVCGKLISKGRKHVANSLKLLLSVWHRLLSVVMQPKSPSDDEIVMVGELAKIFLSRYHDMEKFLERPMKDWDLQNASCHLMLLILPDYMKKFGCLRNYWEGGHMGERSITKLKKSLPHGAHMDGSVRSAIRRYFVDVVLSQLMETELFRDNNVKTIEQGAQYAIDEGDSPFENVLNNNENCTKQSYDRYRRFRVYKSTDSVEEAIQDNQPLALVYLGYTKTFYVLTWESLNNCRQRSMSMIDFKDGTVKEGTYTVTKDSMLDSIRAGHLELSRNNLIFSSDILSQATSCVALPYMIVRPNDDNILMSEMRYYVRTEEHLELRNVVEGIPVFSYPTLYMDE